MTILDCRPFMAVGVSCLAAALIAVSGKWPNLREGWSVIASVVKLAVLLSMIPAVLAGDSYEWTLLKLTDDIGLTLRTDPAGMIFALLAAVLWVVINFYSVGYMRYNNEHGQTGYFAAFAVCMSSVMGIAMSANLLTFFVFYEMLTLASYPLVIHKRIDESAGEKYIEKYGKELIRFINYETLSAGRKYLAYTLVSGQLFLAATVVIYCLAGSMDFVAGGFLTADMADSWVLQATFFVMMIAASVKAAVMPLHGWLPAAMVAPTPVSALLHAVAVVKTGVFCVLRVIGFVFGPKLLSDLGTAEVVAWFAAATILISSLMALKQDHLKRRLAFSTIGQLSYIVLGAALLSPISIKGAYLHLVSHAVMKITLFMCAGYIISKTHRNNISEMQGIAKDMPVTMACYTIASLGIAGMPFLVGFISKWNLALGAVEAGQALYVFVWVASALLAAAYLLPLTQMAYFKPSVPEVSATFGKTSLLMIVPICITTVFVIVLGVWPDAGVHFYELADMTAQAVCKGFTEGGWR